MGPFVQVVLGQIISLFGNAALRFVLPLILLRQTGSAAVYGAATALALLPALAGTLAGGVLADRCCKARLMVVLDLAAAGLALGAAASADDLPVVLWAPAALCALYALQGLYQPVVRASLPLLLSGDRLVQGNAVIQLVDTLDELLGPLLGSALLGVMGLGPLLVLCGACFAASALLEWQIRIPGDRPQPRTQRKPDFAADLRESLTYLYHSRPELLRLAGIMALVNLVEIPAVVVGIPVMIVQYLGQSDVVLGAVQAVLSVGGLAGGALAGRSRHPLSDRQALGLLLGIAGLCAAMGVVLWVPPLACGGVALVWGDGRRYAVQCVVLCPAADGAAAGTAGPGDRLYNGAGQPDPAGGAGRVRGTVRCVFRLSGGRAAGCRCRVGGVSDRRHTP